MIFFSPLRTMTASYLQLLAETNKAVRVGEINYWWELWANFPEGFPKCKTFIDVLRQQKVYQKEKYREWIEWKRTQVKIKTTFFC